MTGIIDGERDIARFLTTALVCITIVLFIFGFVGPYLTQDIDIESCNIQCGCKIEGKPYDSFHGNIVRYLYAENGDLYAKLCSGETMRVDNFNSGVPV